jgi:hypothetical protein
LSDIYTAKPTGTDQFQVTNTPGEAETAPSYNADASAIAYIVPGGAAAGIYRSPSASGTRISVKVADGITSTYWTDGTGRSRTMQVYNLNRRAVKPKPTKKPEAKAEAPKAPK